MLVQNELHLLLLLRSNVGHPTAPSSLVIALIVLNSVHCILPTLRLLLPEVSLIQIFRDGGGVEAISRWNTNIHVLLVDVELFNQSILVLLLLYHHRSISLVVLCISAMNLVVPVHIHLVARQLAGIGDRILV